MKSLISVEYCLEGKIYMYSEGDDVNGEFIQPNNIVKYCHLHNITEAT